MTSPLPSPYRPGVTELIQLVEASSDLMGIEHGGRLLWLNRAAAQALGTTPGPQDEPLTADALAAAAGPGWRVRRRQTSADHADLGLIVVATGPNLNAGHGEHDIDALTHAASHDGLTGLPNRKLLYERLEHALARYRRRQETVAVIFLDLDRFKRVNDSMGHHAGDELLVAAARRLEAAVRPSDTVARFAGDEFVVVCEGLLGEIEAMGIADRIRESLEKPFIVQGQPVYVSASLGIASPRSDDYEADTLLSDADAAMFRAKEGGRGRSVPFDRGMRERARERLETEAALRVAVDAGDLTLAFQPIVNLGDGRPVALEALARWDQPGRGPLGPERFIALAEEVGLIAQVGAWAIRAACEAQAEWAARGTVLPLHVNVSGRQLSDPDSLVETVSGAIAGSGVDPSTLCLEITESALVDDLSVGAGAVERLRELGVKVVLDDFGTGWASLRVLRRLPVDGVKIDRGFVAGVHRHAADRAIAGAVVGLAAGMGLSVVAEGVENEEQRRALLEVGCPLGQGYLFSAAVDGGVASRWLASAEPVGPPVTATRCD